MDDALVREPWRGTPVLVTGHTGFKGSWLSLWLNRLGAEVTGLSNGVPTAPSLYEEARIAELLHDERVDVRRGPDVLETVRASAPAVVFHLAAQSLVRASYEDPVGTWETNVLGTVNVLEACRATPGVRAVVVVTSDKCYENRGDGVACTEGAALGGKDPYSASKAAAELVTASWRDSFGADGPAIASVRAGNVIGGGDWSRDRLIPDFVRAATSNTVLRVRNPTSIRPWQDVLDCIAGYLTVAERLLAGDQVDRAWNFGPDHDDRRDVGSVIERLAALWPSPVEWAFDEGSHPPEAPVLVLDSTAARNALGWRPAFTLDESLERLVHWYAAHASGVDARDLAMAHLARYAASQGPDDDR